MTDLWNTTALYALGADSRRLFEAAVLLLAAVVVITLVVTPRTPLARLFVSAATLVLMLRYVVFRVSNHAAGAADDSAILWQTAFLAIEFISLFSVAFLWLIQARTCQRTEQVETLTRELSAWPRVAVFIPTYNESRDILERTIAGASHIDYPDYSVVVLDDGRRPWVRELAGSHGARYVTRCGNTHAKAGNMNNGLAAVLADETPPDLVAILDADFVAARAFLRRTVPLFADETVGLVQTPQVFFNTDPLQTNLMADTRLADDQRFAQSVDLPGRDAWGLATSCGTSSVVRVRDLLAIGGFPTESICEDTLTSVKFWTIGKKTVFLDEPVSQGLAVEGIPELLTQRGRWSLGNMQIVTSPWGPFSRAGLSALQRLVLFNMLIASVVSPIFRAMVFSAPIVYLWLGISVMDADPADLFGALVPFLGAHYAGLAWISRGTVVPLLHDSITTVEYFATFPAGLIGLFGNRNQKFKVTPKGIARATRVAHVRLIVPLLIILALYAGGVLYNVVAVVSPATADGTLVLMCIWLCVSSVIAVFAIYIAIDLPSPVEPDWTTLAAPVRVLANGRTIHGRVTAMSPSRASVMVDEPIPKGVPLRLVLEDGFEIPCRASAGSATSSAPGQTGACHLVFKNMPETQRAVTARILHDVPARYAQQAQPVRGVLAAALRIVR